MSRASRVRLRYSAGAGLVPALPVQPVGGVAGQAEPQEQGSEQVLDLRNGQRDHAVVVWRRLIRAYLCCRLGAGAVF